MSEQAQISARQKKQLKGLAHHLDPIVRVGKSKVTDAVLAELRRTFEAHELIKVRIDVESGDERKSIATSLAASTEAHLVTNVGKIAILYKRNATRAVIKLVE